MSITLHHRISHLHEWDTRSKYNQPPGSPPQGSSSGPVGIWSGDNGDTYCQQNYEYWSTDVSRPHRHTPLLKSSWIRVPYKIVFANNDFVGRYTKYKIKIWVICEWTKDNNTAISTTCCHPIPHQADIICHFVWCKHELADLYAKKIPDFIKTLKTLNIFNDH